MRYFKVTCVRGHLGTRYQHGTISFYECGKNMLEAMDKARRHGGVKHDKLPLACEEVSKAEYEANIKVSAYVRAKCK